MFRTRLQDMAGAPGMFEEGLAHWHSISRVLRTHWYHVIVQERLESRFISKEEMLNDETALAALMVAQSEDYQVTDVQLVSPPWMNKGSTWRMEKLERVATGLDKFGVVVCLLEVEEGEVYSDVHDPDFDPKTLSNLRQIYQATASRHMTSSHAKRPEIA